MSSYPQQVILLTGEKAAGKDTFAAYLCDHHGFATMRVSDFVREEAARRGIEKATTKDLQDIGDILREETGDNGIWISRVLERAREQGVQKLIINGIRNPAEIAAARKLVPYFVLVGVVAGLPIRWERLRARAAQGQPLIYEDFLAMDRRDHGEGQPESGQRVADCLFLVLPENRFANEGSLEDLALWADEAVARLPHFV